MCMPVAFEGGKPVVEELQPCVKYKVVRTVDGQNPYYQAITINGNEAAPTARNVLHATPYHLRAITHRGLHVFNSWSGAEHWRLKVPHRTYSETVIEVIVWGTALKFDIGFTTGYAVEFLTAAPGYVL